MPPRTAPRCLTWSDAISPSRSSITSPDSVTINIQAQIRSFHNSHRCLKLGTTRLRRDMYSWLDGPGKVFRDPAKGSTNYLSAYDRSGVLIRSKKSPFGARSRGQNQSDQAVGEEEALIRQQESEAGLSEEQIAARSKERAAMNNRGERNGVPPERLSDLRPYPLNLSFRSQPVLSEELREEIYRQVVEEGIDVSTASAAFGVDMRRVAAVVRLKTIEKQWIEKDIPLARPYATAVLSMLPQTPFNPRGPSALIAPHESINDLPVHPATRPQIFHPASESRSFTRTDAARTFNSHLLPADARIPHPELITLEKEHLQGISRTERWERQQERDAVAKAQQELRQEQRKLREERTVRTVAGRRWDFQFKDISAENTGTDGRNRNAIGVRYGWPHEDRKRGLVKIPVRVD